MKPGQAEHIKNEAQGIEPEALMMEWIPENHP